MKLRFVFCTLVVIATVATQAADFRPALTNKVSKVSKVSTNTPPATATNQLVLTATNHLDLVVTNDEPKTPGENFTNTVDMEFVRVSGFWAGRHEVTQKAFQKVMGSNPSATPGDDHPVDSVSWNDAMDFCQKLTEQEIADKKLPEGFSYRLPTESEWESLLADASLADAVTSTGGPRTGSSAVGSLAPNSLGLYDVRGNVLEFCLGDSSKAYRVLRGGSWQDNFEVNLRPIFRVYAPPGEAKNTYGFRCLLVVKPAE
jgi:formylglycine-generating enzyme required for sulfatase activity